VTLPVARILFVALTFLKVLVPPVAVTVDPDTAPVADNVEHVTALKLALPVTVRFPSEPTFVIWGWLEPCSVATFPCRTAMFDSSAVALVWRVVMDEPSVVVLP
jgi:hypothetical protein